MPQGFGRTSNAYAAPTTVTLLLLLLLCSCSVDLVQCTGFDCEPCCLNDELTTAVQVMAAAFDKWGVMPTLDFVRGGRTGVCRLNSWLQKQLVGGFVIGRAYVLAGV